MADESSPVLNSEVCQVTKTLVHVEMARLTEDIGTEHLTLRPKKVWARVRQAMDEAHPFGWSGLFEDQVIEKVRKARIAQGLGDSISTVMNTPEYRMMKDTECAFLQG